MKTFASEDEKSKYVNAELDRVTEILDQLAEDTGDVYVALRFKSIGSLLSLGWNVHKAIHDTTQVITQRMGRAGYVRDEAKGEWVRLKGAPEAPGKGADHVA